MILYYDGTNYVSTCYESIVMSVHFMTVHLTLKVPITYRQRKVKCKASATTTVRGLCFFTYLAQENSKYSFNVSICRLLAWHVIMSYSSLSKGRKFSWFSTTEG